MVVRFRALVWAVVVTLVCSTAFWFAPRPALADLTDDEVAARQERLDYFADLVVGDKDTNEVSSLSWFSDMEYDLENNRLTFYSKAPLKVLGVIAPNVISDAAAEGITVTEVSVKASLNEMLTQQRQLSDQIEADGVITGPNSIEINTSAASQSLTVTTNSEDMAEADVEGADTAAEAADVYEDELSEIVDVPVDVKLDDQAIPGTSTRQNDSSPWYGGLGVIPPTGGYCSGAFGARRTVSSVTTYYMLTAYHCGAGTYKDRASQTIGATGSLGSPARSADIAAIQISSGSSGNKVFDGAWNNADNYAKYVGSLRQGPKRQEILCFRR